MTYIQKNNLSFKCESREKQFDEYNENLWCNKLFSRWFLTIFIYILYNPFYIRLYSGLT